MKKAVLARLNGSDKQVLGHFTLFSDTDKLFEAKSLELPDLCNQVRVSCIPTGKYRCKARVSQKFGRHFIVEELEGGHVKGRTWILIHAGNYYTQILGCILLGRTHTDINGDGYRDVTSSRNTIAELVEKAGEEFILHIIEC